MIDENAAPIPRPNIDIVSLSPSAEQYFLFSRVDGKLTVQQLCQTCGLGREKTLDCLLFLAQAGALDIPGFEAADGDLGAEEQDATQQSGAPPVNAPPKKQTRQDPNAKSASPSNPIASGGEEVDIPPAKQPGVPEKSAKKPRVTPNYPIPLQDFEFQPELLAIETPLGDELRRELICLHEQLDEMSYYDLFGLKMGAKRKEIKKAYFRLSKRHHPDKFFRQDLGRLGSMQETVFKELSNAYKTLSKKRARDDYDAALSAHLAEQASDAEDEAADGGAPEARSANTAAERNKRKAVGALLVRRAQKLEQRGDFAQAAGEYRKALALSRDPDLAMRVASVLLDSAHMPGQAASFARAAIKLGASVASSRYLLGRAMQAQGANGAAIQEYKKVLIDAPEHPGAIERLAELE